MSDNINNFHRVLRDPTDGFFYKLLPTQAQLDTFKVCKDLVQEALENKLQQEYGTMPKFRLQGSWAYGTCNMPNRGGQEIDFDYGCYLPEKCFSEDQEKEADRLIGHVKDALSDLCFREKWQLDDSNPSCLRIRGFMDCAHFDVPLYAAPDDMFDDLQSVPIASRKNKDVLSESNESYDSMNGSNMSFIGDTRPQDISKFFGESSFSGSVNSTNRFSVSLESATNVKDMQLDSIHEKEYTQPKSPVIKDVSLIRNDGKWKVSNCERVREWFLAECNKHYNQGQQLRSIVRYIKAWRDYNFGSEGRKAPTSLALMILTVATYEHQQKRDDLVLLGVASQLPSQFLEDIMCADIKNHEDEVFNNYGEDSDQNRAEDSKLAQELFESLNSCATQVTEEGDCLGLLQASFGEKITENIELVTIHVPKPKVEPKHQPQKAASAAIIPSQIGG